MHACCSRGHGRNDASPAALTRARALRDGNARSSRPPRQPLSTPPAYRCLHSALLHRLSPSAPARCDGAPPAPTAASELEGKVEEQAAAAEAHSAQLQQLSAEHSTQLQQAAALLEAQAREKFETAVAHERVIAREAQEQAVLAERLAYLSALKQLELDVDVLTRVLAPTVYLMQSFPTSLCLPLRARRPPPRAPARHPFCAATP
ncbi:hypothetical protein EMIHUDRAFT_317558 [Emiliania huxleyi CCMP1516]|uniref:Uncharacterized protein n=2 Tax=Emiliania huxleyi TaxID=2903 RepID=A0A0D3KQ34_EMIH1|nr:hypothetical protein EMIHUDRAFT_317558 [Emiliania huxleyi CCMP1516]EOD37869.1 hypothetical protein EMIHUDRAFT_317558 [Emiliania huxleyi CCMP1516]|eukprot:XP_005790298.1 hypothetical protein EMIHUDRAFT_317558 [Emiliania huxleyi CCMP1516]